MEARRQDARPRTLQRVAVDLWQVGGLGGSGSGGGGVGERGRGEQPQARLGGIACYEELSVAQLGFDGARVFRGAPVAQGRGGVGGIAGDGEGLVCDSFEVCLGVSAHVGVLCRRGLLYDELRIRGAGPEKFH